MGWLAWTREKAWSAVSMSVKYTYGTVSHLFEQVGVLPKTIKSLLTHLPSRSVTRNLSYIALHDLLPLVLINLANGYIQQSFSQEGEEENEWSSANYAIQCSLMLLGLAVRAYNFRQGTQLAARTLLVSCRAADAFNQVSPRPQSPLCIEEKCTLTQQIKGSGREVVELQANALAVYLLGCVSGMEGLSKLLSVYANGRYVAKSTTPERCPDHKMIQSEYALALGLGHAGMMVLLKSALTATSGLPPEFCLNTMEQMLLILQIAIAAHLQPPLVRPDEQTLPLDPMDVYERFIGWCTKVIASGLKKQIPALLKGPSRVIPWQAIADSAYSLVNYPPARQFRYMILPPMLHSGYHFIKDPVVKEDWKSFVEQMDRALTFIINKANPYQSNAKIAKMTIRAPKEAATAVIAKTAAWAPQSTAVAVKMVFGFPEFITVSLLIIIGEQKSMDYLRALRTWFGELTIKINEDKDIKLPLPKGPALRGNQPSSVTEEKERPPARIPSQSLLKKNRPDIDPKDLFSSHKGPGTIGIFSASSSKAVKNDTEGLSQKLLQY